MAEDKSPQTAESGILLSVNDVSKAFGEHVIFEGLSLEIREHETLAVLGKSGTGKSVLLKLLIGLLTPDKGTILYRGKSMTDMGEKELTKVRKNIGFLFQGAALFDSMTIGQNLETFLLKHEVLSPKERQDKIARALDVVGLPDVIDRLPSELSGGMRKRAGLARSIVVEPELILYDEPTTGLDPITALSIAELINSLQFKLGIASVVVTHDLPTAFAVSDRAVVLNESKKIYDGKIEEMEKSGDPFLVKYLQASIMDKGRKSAYIQELKKLPVSEAI
ncbi:MAG: ATP-binding cassette domain-containing protein [Candidatus Kapaibacterium sp.]|jgi:phospholipid/cholesterol/gamma-HCH transport system ATP-binding protein